MSKIDDGSKTVTPRPPGSVHEILEAIANGESTSLEIANGFIDHTAAVDDDIEAWAQLDPTLVRRRCEQLDASRERGESLGALHGLPIGIKDIFDTADLPTENGSPIHRARQPGRDAHAVARLRANGAVIFGKTVTTEFATYTPGKTKNPRNPNHTPGGSSSGSAASVASGMVPAALGSQTNGSVIRPAAYCGVVGYKPTHGLIGRSGVFMISRTLDHVGLFTTAIEDIVPVMSVLVGIDIDDPDTLDRGVANWSRASTTPGTTPPKVGFVETPAWERASAETKAKTTQLASALGGCKGAVELPDAFNEALNIHKTIMCADLADNLRHEYEHHRAGLSTQIAELIEFGRSVSALDYLRAQRDAALLRVAIDRLFDDHDLLMTPAACGPAPRGLESTGDPAFCTLWPLRVNPALSMPWLSADDGLPMGVQLIGRRNADLKLLRDAHWLDRKLRA
jgi:Asp-tRNA(Asn)/Glu-tRNA(Gln) amidotransferase A subunit family amidase